MTVFFHENFSPYSSHRITRSKVKGKYEQNGHILAIVIWHLHHEELGFHVKCL
jgi:hypothetical protein